MHKGRLGSAVVVLVTVTTLLLTGCGVVGGNAGLETPEGYTRVSTQLISFAYPSSWNKIPSDAYPKGWKAEYGKGPQGSWDANVAVQTQGLDAPSAKLALLRTQTSNLFSSAEFNRTASHALDVPGAASAWRMDYVYVPPNAPTGEKGHYTDVAVLGESKNVARLRINYYTDTLSNKVLDTIVDSIVVK